MSKVLSICLIFTILAISVANAEETKENQEASYQPVTVDGMNYYYKGGTFYQRSSAGYVIVAAPKGAVVPALPPEATTITVNGKSYSYCNYIYYKEVPSGYAVTGSPFATEAQAAPPPPAQAPVQNTPATPAVQATVIQPVIYQQPREPDSQNPIKKLGRGIVNVVLGVCEIPINMGEIARKEGPLQSMSYGFLKGTGFFVLREVVGVTEVGTFLIPLPGTIENGVRDWGYGPLMLPEWVVR